MDFDLIVMATANIYNVIETCISILIRLSLFYSRTFGVFTGFLHLNNFFIIITARTISLYVNDYGRSRLGPLKINIESFICKPSKSIVILSIPIPKPP